ncbi:MAG: M23 family metallopeptidase [Thermoanaerobaculaceae bacterium]|jgi:hypothetical protein|nr:M23 family metallopeptidase [Thermoanaerobaculaceae bacterium]
MINELRLSNVGLPDNLVSPILVTESEDGYLMGNHVLRKILTLGGGRLAVVGTLGVASVLSLLIVVVTARTAFADCVIVMREVLDGCVWEPTAGGGTYTCYSHMEVVFFDCSGGGNPPGGSGTPPGGGGTPPGGGGQPPAGSNPLDVDNNGRLDCWKSAVSNYDTTSESYCCGQYGVSNSDCEPACSRTHQHRGQDIKAPEGSDVRAVGAGTVDYLDTTTGGGNTVRINHGDGTWSVYFHLSGYADGLAVGDSVSPGDVIGFVGHTGCGSCSPHLHLQMQNRQLWATNLTHTTDPTIDLAAEGC